MARRDRRHPFLAYAVANNVGFAMLSGASVRYRFYTRWGITAEELSRIVFSYSVTFWLGLLALGGLSLARQPAAGRAGTCRVARWRRRVGWVLMLAVVGVRRRGGACGAGRSGVHRLELAAAVGPASRSRQLGISVVDWALAGAVLYVLLPPGGCRSSRSSAPSSRRSCSGWRATCPAASACSKG